MKINNINPVLFRANNTITKPDNSQTDVKNQINDLSNVTPDYSVNLPQKYTKLDTLKLPNGTEFHTYKLANGHKITIVPMENSPAIVKNYVNVGSMNETDDIKGISHFLEHMAFNGTIGSQGYEKLNQGDSFSKIEQLGGWTNASTGYAVTDYVNSTPLLNDKDLETQLKVIASMTEDLALTDEMIEKEKGPVCSEINMYSDKPECIGMDQTTRTLFNIKSTADDLVAGSVQHIQNLNRDKVKKYYDTYYTPDNMNLVITGDIDPEKTIELVAKYFKSNKTRNCAYYEEKLTPINKTIRKDFISDKATSTDITIGFSGPASNNTKEQIIWEIVQKYLDSDEVGIVKEVKKYNTYPAFYSDKISSNPNNPNIIILGAQCSEENSEVILKKIFNKLNQLEKPSEKTLNNIKEALLLSIDDCLEYSNTVNNLIGQATLIGNTEYLTDYKNILNSITVNDVGSFIKKYINIDKAAVTVMHPKTTIEEINKNYQNANSITFKGKKRQPINTDKISEETLNNNFRILFQEAKSDNFYATLNLETDILVNKFNPAAIDILAEIYNMGTKNLSEDEFEKFKEENNIEIGVSLGNKRLKFRSFSNSKNISKTINYMNEILTNPGINEENYKEAISRIEDSLKRRKDTASSLYIEHESKNNPLYTSAIDIEEGLKTVTLDEVKRLHEYIKNNSCGSIIVNVPENKPEIKQIIIDNFNKFNNVKEYNYKTSEVYTKNNNPIVITKPRNITQADIMQTYKFQFEDTLKNKVCEVLINNILNSSKEIGLFNTLREKEHLAYSVHSSIDRIGDCCELSCSILTTTDNKDINEISYENVQKSIDGFHRQINALLNSEYSDEDLENAKQSFKANLLNVEGIPTKLSAINGSIKTKYGINEPNLLYETIDTITREDIQEFAKKAFANPPVYTIVASQDTLDANKEYLKKLEQA